MTIPAHFIVDAVVIDEQVSLSLEALCRATGSSPSQVHALVVEGVLAPTGEGPESWTFSGPALRQTRSARRLIDELELGLPAVALVLQLLQDVQALRARLRRAGLED